MEIKTFFRHDQKEIVALTRQFLESEFLFQFPHWEKKVSFVISGSVAAGFYDELSDIDIDSMTTSKRDAEELLANLRSYKPSVWKRDLPIQFHRPYILADAKERLVGHWEHDAQMREMKQALIVLDPGGRFAKLQKAIRWYPRPILKEKVTWLYAESVFLFVERFSVACKRKNTFYAIVLKHQMMSYLGNALLLSENRYPVFDKHLSLSIQSLGKSGVRFQKSLDDLMDTHELKDIHRNLHHMIRLTERVLLAKKLIPKRDFAWWRLQRPQNKVEFL